MRLMRMAKVSLVCVALCWLVHSAQAGPLSFFRSSPARVQTSHAGGTVVTSQGAPCCQSAPVVVQDCCPAPCPTKKICVWEPGKKTVTHVEYRCECKTICVPTCSLMGLCGFGKKGCGDCGCDCNCGKPREVRKLWKRIRKEECCQDVCKPIEVPCEPKCCTTACPATCTACPAPCGAVAPAAPTAFSVPAPVQGGPAGK